MDCRRAPGRDDTNSNGDCHRDARRWRTNNHGHRNSSVGDANQHANRHGYNHIRAAAYQHSFSHINVYTNDYTNPASSSNSDEHADSNGDVITHAHHPLKYMDQAGYVMLIRQISVIRL